MKHNLNHTPPLSPPSKNHESGLEFSRLALTSIRRNGGTQSRTGLDQNVVDAYAEAIRDGVVFPPVIVFYDGSDHWLADGFHRYDATEKAGRTHIAVDVRQGTRRDAVLYSVGANAEHGLQRTRDDKIRAVKTLLDDPEWAEWSDREIARRCNVSAPFVATRRPTRALTVNVYSENARPERKYTDKHGTETVMNVDNIGSPGHERASRLLRRVATSEFNQMWDDPEVQADVVAADLDQQAERDERIAMSGASAVEADNESLRRQLADRDKTIARLMNDKAELKNQADYWKGEAIALGWKHPAGGDANAA